MIEVHGSRHIEVHHREENKDEESNKGGPPEERASPSLSTASDGVSCNTLLSRIFLTKKHNLARQNITNTRYRPNQKCLPCQQEKTFAHSFVLGPELLIQYTYTYVKNSEHHPV